MKNRIEEYIGEVMNHLVVEERMRKRIEADLRAHITEESDGRDVDQVLARMGLPEDVAREFMDSIYEDKSDIIQRLIQESHQSKELEKYGAYEYKSRATLFGLPLVHVNFRRRGRVRTARGIIAVGDIAVGLLSCGGIALGGISVGGISLGLLGFGGVALGILAFGGAAVGTAAMGGLAVGKIAQGGLAVGKVAIGGEAVGRHVMEQGANYDSVFALVKEAYPGLSDWIIRFFAWPWKFFGQIGG